jgi:protoporphyrinogen oxidase
MNSIITGTGISGLVSALILSEKKKDANIYLLEKGKEPGGLLRAFDYGEFGQFDYGMHNMLETSLPELDKMLFDLLPPSEWQVLEGNKRDIAGAYYRGKVQYATPYFDLRHLPLDEYRDCVAGLFEHLNVSDSQPKKEFANAAEYAEWRFGKTIAEKTIIPSVEKIHQKKAQELDYMSTLLTPMNRVALFDEELTKKLTESQVMRDHIAFVDQRNLPLERSTGRRAYYPVKYGMYRVVNALIEKLKARGVEILTQAEMTAIHKEGGRIQSVDLNIAGEKKTIRDIDHFIWTGAIPILGRLLGAKFDGLKNDKPLKTVVINLILNKKPDIKDLYYFFCYDPGFKTFRLTNFSNYCEGAFRNGGYPVAIEFLVNEEYLANTTSIEQDAIDELFRFGITEPGTEVLFAKAEILESGFPMPSVNNIAANKNIRNQVKAMQLENLLLVGILAEDNLFFQTDVLIDVYKKLKDGDN